MNCNRGDLIKHTCAKVFKKKNNSQVNIHVTNNYVYSVYLTFKVFFSIDRFIFEILNSIETFLLLLVKCSSIPV